MQGNMININLNMNKLQYVNYYLLYIQMIHKICMIYYYYHDKEQEKKHARDGD